MKAQQLSRLRERYTKDVVPALTKEFGYKNINAVPKITKVVVNMGLGEATQNAKIIDTGADELVAHHRPEGRRAPREEIDRAVQGAPGHADRRDGHAARRADVRVPRSPDEHRLPRVRDFRGVSPKGFDGRGNFTLGLRDQLIFLEIDYLKVDKARGMNVSVVTTAKTDEEARKLLQLLGMPFRRRQADGREDEIDGDDREGRAREEDAQIQGAAPQPLPALRTAARRICASSRCAGCVSASWR